MCVCVCVCVCVVCVVCVRHNYNDYLHTRNSNISKIIVNSNTYDIVHAQVPYVLLVEQDHNVCTAGDCGHQSYGNSLNSVTISFGGHQYIRLQTAIYLIIWSM